MKQTELKKYAVILKKLKRRSIKTKGPLIVHKTVTDINS